MTLKRPTYQTQWCFYVCSLPAPRCFWPLRGCIWGNETIIVIHAIHLCSTLISLDLWVWSVSDVGYLSHWWVTYAFRQSAMRCHAFCLLLAAATVLDFSKMMLFSSSYFVKISLWSSHEKYSALSAVRFSVRLSLKIVIGLPPQNPPLIHACSWLLMRKTWVKLTTW